MTARPAPWIAVRSAPLRHAPFALFIGGLLAYGAAFAWRLVDRFDLYDLIYAVNRDDAFYYFQIAWRLAGGEFSTFDGGLTRTNGYHPLWLFLITPFYWIFDKAEALFAIKAFEIMLVAGGVALFAGAARAARLPWILLFAALPALYQRTALFAGMEAAAALFMLGLFVLAACLFARDPARWRWPLAAVAFALPWVRLEYVAVSVAATAALWLIERSDRRPSVLAAGEAKGDGDGSAPALNAAAPLLGALAGVVVYFAYNGIVFGGIVPVSAATKALWSQRLWELEGGYSLAGNIHGFLQTDFFDHELLVAIEVCVCMLLVWWFSRRPRGREDWLLLAFLVGVFGLASGHLAKFAQSVLTVHPRWGSYGWYFVPMHLMEVLVVPARCYAAIWFVRRVFGPERRRASRIPSHGIVMLGAVFLYAKSDFTAPFRYVQEGVELHRGSTYGIYYGGALVTNRVLPGNSVIGTWDSGRFGYFSRFPVVNLDGLVNSWEYLRAQKEGSGLAVFHQRYGITHWAQGVDRGDRREAHSRGRTVRRPPHVPALLEGPLINGSRNFKLWSLDEGDRSGWFRKRMEPHLERQADGVGLLVEGRLAQAFAWDCAPNAAAVWELGGGRRETVLNRWTRTQIGFCTDAIVLPHGALPPVRAAAMTPGEYLADRVGGRRPAIDADFDVHLVENRLIYVKEGCGPEDVAASFFVAVFPVDPDDLPGPRRPHGFDNLDFRFDDRGSMFGGVCAVEVLLPEYGIAAVRTGQYEAAEGGFHHLWEGEIRPESD